MIADFLNVSFPKEESGGLLDELALFLSGIGGWLERTGMYRLSTCKGSITLKYRSGVICLGVSGACLRYMREFCPNTLGDFLMLIGSYPHRVSLSWLNAKTSLKLFSLQASNPFISASFLA